MTEGFGSGTGRSRNRFERETEHCNTGRSLGLPLARSRLVVAVFAALLTAVSTFVVGPPSLAGLIAPHVARLAGFVRIGHQLAASALAGACLLVAADWLSRVIIYLYKVPTGLFASLIGGPCLPWLLNRKAP
ncbi:iron chelate uptake ABC transporter family permease subunit [Sinorhizobium sp. BG8]|uniref:iron chelate uptake ABC transporter family permease subunit n=1 Tax=Sinorhizobium sp. BG8 TaxID=2613773 RepID=UPI00193DB3C8|nr:iron chelate uptake ABC transporter family permease subunit [Sinorhizobium sp. BG8]